MAARLKASAVFLTYSQVGEVTLDSLEEFLLGIPFVRGGIVCEERHQDGGRHFHAWLDLKSQSTFTNARFDHQEIHPNVVITPGNKKSPACQNRINYCKKDGDFRIFGGEGYELPTVAEKENVWGEVVAAETREAALEIISSLRPRDAVINARQIDYFLDKKFKPPVREYVPAFARDTFTRVPPVLEEWVNSNLGMFSYWSVIGADIWKPAPGFNDPSLSSWCLPPATGRPNGSDLSVFTPTSPTSGTSPPSTANRTLSGTTVISCSTTSHGRLSSTPRSLSAAVKRTSPLPTSTDENGDWWEEFLASSY